MAAIQHGVTLRPTPRPAEREGSAFSVHDQAMESIKRGVTLRSTPRPPERRPGEEKVVDFASELRQKMMKHRKNEVYRNELQTLTPSHISLLLPLTTHTHTRHKKRQNESRSNEK